MISFDVEVNGNRGQPTQSPTTEKEFDEKPKGKVTARNLLCLLDYQERKCALTGVTLTPSTVSLDHIDPLSGGGENDIANCQLIHREVNAMKGTMPNGQFIDWCEKVAANKAKQGDHTPPPFRVPPG